MTNVRNLIGFDTPSKAKAQEEMTNRKSIANANGEPKVNTVRLKAETLHKIEQIGALIIGNEFVNLTPQERAGYLMEFTYLTKVADSL